MHVRILGYGKIIFARLKIISNVKSMELRVSECQIFARLETIYKVKSMKLELVNVKPPTKTVMTKTLKQYLPWLFPEAKQQFEKEENLH